MVDMTVCPDPHCGAPAEIVDRFDLSSTSGPIEHISTRCVLRHMFVVPTDRSYPGTPHPISAYVRGLGPQA